MENKTNNKLNSVIRNKNVINYIKAQRLNWFGHVDRMANNWRVRKNIRLENDTNRIGRKNKN
jgi:hypothetical protein